MATTRIWDGTTWRDLEGPQGPEGPTVVSTDLVNVAKLGTDGKILVAQADLDARFVNLTGDNMTGSLAVQVGATFTPPATATNAGTVLQVVRDGTAFIEAYSASNTGTCGLMFRKKYGSVAAPTPITANNSMGVIRWQTKPASGAADRTTAQIQVTALGPETQDGFYDGVMSMTMVGAAAGQAASFFELRNLAATGTAATIAAGRLVVTTDNFAVQSNGSVIVKASGSVAGVKSEVTAGAAGDGTGFYASVTGASSANIYGGYFETAGTITALCCGIIARARTTGGTTNTGIRVDVSGAATNYGVRIAAELPAAASSYSLLSESPAQSCFIGSLAVGEYVPTRRLTVSGDAIVRTTLEVVGNITSAGTAHSFASASIPSSAVVGGTAFTPATSAAAGAVGSMRWDENFLYVRTATAWKRVALAAF
jgi:hypothetical protein